MHKVKIILDTVKDIEEFVKVANSLEEEVYLEDGSGYRVNAKSLMGVMYGRLEFKELWVVSDYQHLTNRFIRFTI